MLVDFKRKTDRSYLLRIRKNGLFSMPPCTKKSNNKTNHPTIDMKMFPSFLEEYSNFRSVCYVYVSIYDICFLSLILMGFFLLNAKRKWKSEHKKKCNSQLLNSESRVNFMAIRSRNLNNLNGISLFFFIAFSSSFRHFSLCVYIV